MNPFFRRLCCFLTGCNHGPWLPLSHDNALVQSFLRQCRRCRKMQRKAYLAQGKAGAQA